MREWLQSEEARSAHLNEIREIFTVHVPKIEPIPDESLAQLALLLDRVTFRTNSNDFVWSTLHKKIGPAVRAILESRSEMARGYEIWGLGISQGVMTNFDYLVPALKALYKAVDTFAEQYPLIVKKNASPRGDWHGYAVMIMWATRDLLRIYGPKGSSGAPRRWSYQKPTSPLAKIVTGLLNFADLDDTYVEAAVVAALSKWGKTLKTS